MPRIISRVCVFCGSSGGARPSYANAARELGAELARRGVALVYGGGSVGLMGAVADATLAAGGHVIGVIPHALDTAEVGHRGITERHVVDTMHERKACMTDLSDAFLALPGALGTLDELFECLTWAQLGIHHKPVGMLNVEGYFDELIRFLDKLVREGFLRQTYRDLLMVENDLDTLFDRFKAYESPVPTSWATRVKP